MRSKYWDIEPPPRYRSSSPARNVAGKIPRIPPPSIARMRNSRSSGQGSWTRPCLSAPDDRFGGAPSLLSNIAASTRLLDDGRHPSIHLLQASPHSKPANQSSKGRWYGRLISEDAILEQPGHRDIERAVQDNFGSGSDVGWALPAFRFVGAKADQSLSRTEPVEVRHCLFCVLGRKQSEPRTSGSRVEAVPPIAPSDPSG